MRAMVAITATEPAAAPDLHIVHTCVRTDGGGQDHLGYHLCACGEDFTASPMPLPDDMPQQPQPHPWAEAVDATLASLANAVVSLQSDVLNLRAEGRQGAWATAQDARHFARMAVATADDAIRRVEGLAARVDSLSRSVGAVERQVDDLAGRPLKQQTGKDEFFTWLDQRSAEWRDQAGKAVAVRLCAAAITELRAGTPMAMIVKHMLAEAIHAQDDHGTLGRGRDCARCLNGAGQLLDLHGIDRPRTSTEGVQLARISIDDVYTPKSANPQRPSEAASLADVIRERIAGLPDAPGTFKGVPVPCRRTFPDEAPTDAGRLCGTCGATVGMHPFWLNQPAAAELRTQMARQADEDRFCGQTFDHPPHVHEIDRNDWVCPGVNVADENPEAGRKFTAEEVGRLLAGGGGDLRDGD
jgi:hypothetical protein